MWAREGVGARGGRTGRGSREVFSHEGTKARSKEGAKGTGCRRARRSEARSAAAGGSGLCRGGGGRYAGGAATGGGVVGAGDLMQIDLSPLKPESVRNGCTDLQNLIVWNSELLHTEHYTNTALAPFAKDDDQ